MFIDVYVLTDEGTASVYVIAKGWLQETTLSETSTEDELSRTVCDMIGNALYRNLARQPGTEEFRVTWIDLTSVTDAIKITIISVDTWNRLDLDGRIALLKQEGIL